MMLNSIFNHRLSSYRCVCFMSMCGPQCVLGARVLGGEDTILMALSLRAPGGLSWGSIAETGAVQTQRAAHVGPLEACGAGGEPGRADKPEDSGAEERGAGVEG